MENKSDSKKQQSVNENIVPPYACLSGAEHHKQDEETGIWMPSDEAVEEMRDFSKENRL